MMMEARACQPLLFRCSTGLSRSEPAATGSVASVAARSEGDGHRHPVQPESALTDPAATNFSAPVAARSEGDRQTRPERAGRDPAALSPPTQENR